MLEGYIWLGQAQNALGDYDKANAAFREAIRLSPDSPTPLIYMGVVVGKQQKTDESIAWFRRALAKDPNNLVAHYNLAGTLAMKGEKSEAIREFETVLRIDPKNAVARQQLGMLRGGGPAPVGKPTSAPGASEPRAPGRPARTPSR
jgi:cytochrome c-type biogenesis protein CcmH/NrfG